MEFTGTNPENGSKMRFNPMRDVAYFMPQLLADVETRLRPPKLFPGDSAQLASAGLTVEQLLETHARFSLFYQIAVDPSVKSPFEALKKCGFLDAPAVCQDLVLRAFARSCVGACWHGLRSSTMEGECPPIITAIRQRAEELLGDLHQRQTDAAAAPG